MPVITFRCPHCAADLKTRDDQITAGPVPCPDCRKPIVITRDEFGNVGATVPPPPAGAGKTAKAQKAQSSGKAAAPPAGKSQTTPIVREEPAQRVKEEPSARPRLSRTAIAWIATSVASVATIVGVGIVAWPRGSRTNADAVQDAGVTLPIVGAKQVVPGKGSPTSPSPSARPDQTLAAKQKSAGPPTVAGRLTTLGQGIAAYRARQGHFPSAAPGRDGLPPSERLSWLAELVATVLLPKRPAPSWTDSWRSLHNERFVRQQIPELLNPSIPKVTGAESYPATHFAGVAGVGADAADLPIDDPRAGIFGNGRSTRMQDIRDGASNTLMVVGVTGELGSWAASGTPTVRALTREPYVNGPDGIGTGSPDRMLALKADGSVQEFSAKTDPRILRRMAAMADGLPLDPKVPGEPGDKSPQPSVPDRLAASVPKPQLGSVGANATDGRTKAPDSAPRPPLAGAQPSPKTHVAAPPAPAKKVDVKTALAQRVIRYDRTKPAPLRDVLNELEELTVVPIRGDRHEIADFDDLMETPVSLDLENTTVAAVLEAVLATARLTYEVHADAIQLHRLGPVSGGPASP
jgi:hypothetical protein